MAKKQEIRDESSDELQVKVETLRSEIYGLRSERLDSKVQQTHLIRQKRKDIARILTVLRERELARKA